MHYITSSPIFACRRYTIQYNAVRNTCLGATSPSYYATYVESVRAVSDLVRNSIACSAPSTDTVSSLTRSASFASLPSSLGLAPLGTPNVCSDCGCGRCGMPGVKGLRGECGAFGGCGTFGECGVFGGSGVWGVRGE